MTKNKKLFTFTASRGGPQPFGVSKHPTGINFSVFSKYGTSVSLCLFTYNDETPIAEILLNPIINRTGNVWHILVEGLASEFLYAFRIDGPLEQKKGHLFDQQVFLLDPYARSTFNNASNGYCPKGVPIMNRNFDWDDDKHPSIPMQDLIIYEMHVRGFTQSPSSHTKNKGTFLGIIEKIPYLKHLGINTVELLPINEFNENEYIGVNPKTGTPLVNYWGYSTLNFFSPMTQYATNKAPGVVVDEFKSMVKSLHKNGIEVIIDVVFNHTGEGNEKGPTYSFRGFENSTYYMLDDNGDFLNFSGCGNTMNCNHPVVRELIHNCLRYWVTEMHVDGFRFDLASILGRDNNGTPLSSPPLIEAIALDPLLANTKLIAEAWDSGGLYQVGSFFPSLGAWAEWNGEYRDEIRRFISGISDNAHVVATRLCGSEDLYGDGRTPSHSINFITCHDGFTLKDLVSYNTKHNEENGENNEDGENTNNSWNCGIEGQSDNSDIETLRNRQMKNFHLALMVSQGVPMLHMGDEYGHTKYGNNNTWCHDDKRNWFSWDELKKNNAFSRFYRLMINFRKRHSQFRKNSFLNNNNISWYSIHGEQRDWSQDKQFIAFTLKDSWKSEDIYVAFNACNKDVKISLPKCPVGREWHRIVDTSLAPPKDFSEDDNAYAIHSKEYFMGSHSSIIFKAMII